MAAYCVALGNRAIASLRSPESAVRASRMPRKVLGVGRQRVFRRDALRQRLDAIHVLRRHAGEPHLSQRVFGIFRVGDGLAGEAREAGRVVGERDAGAMRAAGAASRTGAAVAAPMPERPPRPPPPAFKRPMPAMAWRWSVSSERSCVSAPATKPPAGSEAPSAA